ncbi:MAG: iron complex outermembrane receptor protein [Arenicella sp.]|jgi:iron complex outermembrane receptor protein
MRKRLRLELLEPDPVDTGVGMGTHLIPFSPYRVFLTDIKETTMKIHFTIGLLAVALCLSTKAFAAEPLTEIVVTAELLETNALRLANSVTVIDNAVIDQRNAQHLEDLLGLAPNVNFASGASRGRFIQIRGIGERSEFQAPIINSVGLLIDGIDLTGIATAASTLDVQQVEVLRGPQGTLYGANALAGLINIVSNRPSEEFYGRLTAGYEDFGGREVSAVISGPTSDQSGYRVALKHYQSDGFTQATFLDRDDTNNIDETTARASYTTKVSDVLALDFTLLLADIDNGYDAFSLSNTRQTDTDQPGFDRQQTTAAAVKASYEFSTSLNLEASLSLANSDLEYAYDEDWSNLFICQNTSCDSDLLGFDLFYSSFDQYLRSNNNVTFDMRLLSNASDSVSWVAGLYYRDQDTNLERIYTFANDFNSDLETTNSAIYGQVEFDLSNRWSLTTGLRLERREVSYSDITGASAAPEENLWGGRLALEYQADGGAFYYGLVSRGYKPGGFNLDGSLSIQEREFDTETMLNYELGIKQTYLDGTLRLQASLFYQDRDEVQVNQSIVRSLATNRIGGVCPCSFTDFTENAASGTNKGLEVEVDWLTSDRVTVFAKVGLLDTAFDQFLSFDHILADRANGKPFDLNGRDQAQAPSYTAVIGGRYAVTSALSLSGSIEAKDDFLFSNSHESRSNSYQLVNLELAYQAENWKVALYAKNLSDELVKTRGFGSFGNDPRENYAVDEYNQFGSPRVVGMRASMEF